MNEAGTMNGMGQEISVGNPAFLTLEDAVRQAFESYQSPHRRTGDVTQIYSGSEDYVAVPQEVGKHLQEAIYLVLSEITKPKSVTNIKIRTSSEDNEKVVRIKFNGNPDYHTRIELLEKELGLCAKGNHKIKVGDKFPRAATILAEYGGSLEISKDIIDPAEPDYKNGFVIRVPLDASARYNGGDANGAGYNSNGDKGLVNQGLRARLMRGAVQPMPLRFNGVQKPAYTLPNK